MCLKYPLHFATLLLTSLFLYLLQACLDQDSLLILSQFVINNINLNFQTQPLSFTVYSSFFETDSQNNVFHLDTHFVADKLSITCAFINPVHSNGNRFCQVLFGLEQGNRCNNLSHSLSSQNNEAEAVHLSVDIRSYWTTLSEITTSCFVVIASDGKFTAKTETTVTIKLEAPGTLNIHASVLCYRPDLSFNNDSLMVINTCQLEDVILGALQSSNHAPLNALANRIPDHTTSVWSLQIILHSSLLIFQTAIQVISVMVQCCLRILNVVHLCSPLV